VDNGEKPPRRSRRRGRRKFLPTRRWARYLLSAAGATALVSAAVFAYLYVSFARLIDERLHGERERTLPRVYARPLELRRGQLLSDDDLIGRLNDLGYAQRPQAQGPGEFALARGAVTITPREGDLAGRAVRVSFPDAPAGRQAASSRRRGVRQIEVAGRGPAESVLLDR
jgi:hypothetical protein